MQLHEQYRPRAWGDVCGQPKALAKLDRLRARGGLSGRSFWITGQSGTGKTTIARLIAEEVASESVNRWEYGSPRLLPVAAIAKIIKGYEYRPLFGQGVCYTVNEAHGLEKRQIELLLEATENAPDWVTWCFTTTNEGAELFEEQLDASPFGSRTQPLPLARRDLAKPFAARAKQIAEAEGLDGRPIEAYVRLVQKHRQNLRAVLQEIEAGAMMSE
jgi:replication-associated recombination protein RarA